MTNTFEPMNLNGVRFYSAWHLNLNYSSIEKADRPSVIEKCYWPLLNLAESTGCPQGIEISGSSLRIIEMLDPSWLKKLIALKSEGLVEMIASGYEQIVGPLTPAKVNLANLNYGNEVMQELLGASPSVSFVSEQCASSGVLSVHEDAGFEATIMEWENAWIANPSWPQRVGLSPQRFRTSSGIGIIWNHSRLFQGLQKFAHDELNLDSLTQIYEVAQGFPNAALCFYGGDTETFDFRGGRFLTETVQRTGEWISIENIVRLTVDAGAQWVRPSNLIQELPEAGINPFTFENQILTKKQAKYNVVRWAVSGRDNYELNSYAHHQADNFTPLTESGANNPSTLLALWASDLRTHVTSNKWADFLAEHEGVLGHYRGSPSGHPHKRSMVKSSSTLPVSSLENGMLSLTLNQRRGLTVESCLLRCTCSAVLVGRVPYGAIRGPLHSPDWYTGNFVHCQPGQAQDSELGATQLSCWTSEDGLTIQAHLSTINFVVRKTIELHTSAAEYTTTFEFDWKAQPSGFLRAGFVTLNPQAWDWANTRFENHDGGFAPNIWEFSNVFMDCGAPASPSVSASNLVGITEGVIRIKDTRHHLEIELDEHSRGAGLMLAVTPAQPLSLVKIYFSLQEFDDTFRSENRAMTLSFSYRTRFECVVDA